jgi:4-hydroxy-tetrahydrodipicolinate reductase
MAIDIVINGVMGRMGREIATAALADPEVRIAGCIESASHPAANQKLGSHIGVSGCDITVSTSISSFDLHSSVLIDFTTPVVTSGILSSLKNKPSRLVIGTTGLSDAQMELVRESARESSILISPNMSLGVNLLFHLTQVVSERLGKDFDIEIIEAHHRMKKDAPSGTARRLAEIAAESRNLSYEQAVRNGREGITGARTDSEIGVHAVRAGDIVGDHTVLFAGAGERIELRHIMNSRSTLAKGAVIAAKWLSKMPAGLFSMADVLGF